MHYDALAGMYMLSISYSVLSLLAAVVSLLQSAPRCTAAALQRLKTSINNECYLISRGETLLYRRHVPILCALSVSIGTNNVE